MPIRTTFGKIRLRNGKVALPGLAAVGNQAGTAISLTTVIPANKVYQRVGTSKAIPIAGTCAGNPSLIQARVVDFATGTTVYTDWTTVASNVAGTTWSGTIDAPQGDGYRIQVRDGVNTALTAQTDNTFGVGAVILMLGQSNMYLQAETPWFYPLGSSRSRWYGRNGTFFRVGNYNDARPINQSEGNYGTDRTVAFSDLPQTGSTMRAIQGDAIVYFGNVLSEALNIPVCLIERAVSGSAIAEWQPGQPRMVAALAALAAAGGDAEGCNWWQGETDAHNMVKANHLASIAAVHNALMTACGRNSSNFVFQLISLTVGSFNGSVEGEYGAMRAAICEYANSTPGAVLGGCAHDLYTSEGVHTDKRVIGKIGARGGKSMAAAKGVGASAAGPRVLSATRSGVTVILPATHSGGTALMDGAGGTGTALTGFIFTDSNGTHTYTSAISGNNFVFTLGRAVVGPLTVSYGQANTPHAASSTAVPTVASIPCDNALYLNSTTGCPLQPFTAINVT